MNAHVRQILSAVQCQYEEFPYPPVSSLEEEDPLRNLHASFNHDLALVGEERLTPASTIWVPGCGTRWAVMTALQFKDVQIIASDLSNASLELQRRIARSLNITNIEFRQENLLEVSYNQAFDFVSCVGVLHHLPNPQAGFELIARSLKKSGTAEIMVYDRANRQHSIRMQHILRVLDPDCRLSAPERFELALSILRAANTHTDRPRELDRVLKLVESSPDFRRELADFISHPQENYYDVVSLVSALSEAGLTPRSWKMPYLFDPQLLLPDPVLQPILAKLHATDRAQLGYLLSSWLLEVFVRHQDGEAPQRTTPHLHGSTKLREIASTTIYRFNPDGEMIGHEARSKMAIRDGNLWIDAGERRPAVSAFGRAIDCVLEHPRRLLSLSEFGFETSLSTAEVLKLVELARSTRTIDEMADALQAEAGPARIIHRKDVLAVCEHLVRPPFRILALAE